jgi:hypothetical protein
MRVVVMACADSALQMKRRQILEEVQEPLRDVRAPLLTPRQVRADISAVHALP